MPNQGRGKNWWNTLIHRVSLYICLSVPMLRCCGAVRSEGSPGVRGPHHFRSSSRSSIFAFQFYCFTTVEGCRGLSDAFLKCHKFQGELLFHIDLTVVIVNELEQSYKKRKIKSAMICRERTVEISRDLTLAFVEFSKKKGNRYR